MTFDDYYDVILAGIVETQMAPTMDQLFYGLHNSPSAALRHLATKAWYYAKNVTGTYAGDERTIRDRNGHAMQVEPADRPITQHAAWYGFLCANWPEPEAA